MCIFMMHLPQEYVHVLENNFVDVEQKRTYSNRYNIVLKCRSVCTKRPLCALSSVR